MKYFGLVLVFVALTWANTAADEEKVWLSKMPKLNPIVRPASQIPLTKLSSNGKIPEYFKGRPKQVPNCGIAAVNDDSKIYGGVDATPHEFPWQVALYITNDDGLFFASGSLINEVWVLTAGHCTYGASSITVIMGAQNIHAIEPTQVSMISTNIFTHPGFVPSIGLQNDIGLIRLPGSVTYTNEIRPICLPSYQDYIGGGVGLTVSGWGTMSNGNGADILQKASLSSMTDADCGAILNNIDGSVLCTTAKSGTGTCTGDSGGSLMYVSGGKTFSEGIASFIVGSCGATYPDGFTRVTYYLDWISFVTGIAIDP